MYGAERRVVALEY